MNKDWVQFIIILLLIVILLLFVFGGYLIYLLSYVYCRIGLLETSMIDLISVVVDSIPEENLLCI